MASIRTSSPSMPPISTVWPATTGYGRASKKAFLSRRCSGAGSPDYRSLRRSGRNIFCTNRSFVGASVLAIDSRPAPRRRGVRNRRLHAGSYPSGTGEPRIIQQLDPVMDRHRRFAAEMQLAADVGGGDDRGVVRLKLVELVVEQRLRELFLQQ